MPPDPERDGTHGNMECPRITGVAADQLPADLADVVGEAQGVTGAQGVLLTLARHPRLAERYIRFGVGFLTDGLLDARLRELAILRVAWLCRSPYVWGQHDQLADNCGITPPERERIADGPEHPLWTPAEADVLAAVDDLFFHHRLAATAWEALTTVWDEPQIIEFLLLVGHFTTLCGLTGSIALPPEAEAAALPDRAARRPDARNMKGQPCAGA